MKFTDEAVDALEARRSRYEVWGDDLPGFGIRVAPSGRKSWIYLYRYQGRPRRLTLGAYPALSATEAGILYDRARALLAEGRDPAAESLERAAKAPLQGESARLDMSGKSRKPTRRRPARRAAEIYGDDPDDEEEELYSADDAIDETIDEDGVLELLEDDDDDEDDADSISRAAYERRLAEIQALWTSARQNMRVVDWLMPPMPPPEAPDIPLSAMKAQHDKVSNTISKTFNILGACSLFFVITLAAPDISFMAADARVQMPVMNFAISFDAFLLIGPVLLTALTIYLHIFIRHQRRFSAIPQEQQLPTIFNISDGAPSLITWVLFYWMPPLIMGVFAWRALPRALMGPVMLEATVIMAAALLYLQGRRCHPTRRRWAVPALSTGMVGLILFGLYAALIEVPFHRDLYLFRGDMTEKDLRGFDLEYAYLKEAKLDRTNLQGARISHAVMSEASLSGADLRETRMQQTDARGSRFDGANLTDADLSGADLRGAFLSGAILEHANLERARLEGAFFEPERLKTACNWMLADFGPEPPGYLGLPDNLAQRVQRSDFSLTSLDDMRLCDVEMRNANFDKTSFHGGNAEGADLRNLSGNSILAMNASFLGADLRNASFVDAELSGVAFGQAQLTGATFRRASLQGTNFRAAVLRDVRFIGASLVRADFLDADLTGASFRSADLDQADFTDAVLIEADLRGTENLTCNQLVLARDWELALRDEALACGAQIPKAPD
ncbi:MAG: pentapeptide repeat-containing protein [Rhodospirillales bacterium]